MLFRSVSQSRYRDVLRFSPKTKNFEKIVDLIKWLGNKGHFVEISAVLTDHNIAYLPDFARFVFREFANTILYPFPVRFSEYNISNTSENISFIEKAWNAVPLGILPPVGYKEQLIEVIQNNKTTKCYLPLIVLSVCEDGFMPFCPCGIISDHGNIFDKKHLSPPSINDLVIKRVMDLKEQKCKSCFTHFDIINLFFENKISLQEVSQCGIFQDSRMNKLLESFKLHNLNLLKNV